VNAAQSASRMPLAERSESTNKQEAAESAANLSWSSWAGFWVSSLVSGSYGCRARGWQ